MRDAQGVIVSAKEFTSEELSGATPPWQHCTADELAARVARRHGLHVADVLGPGRQPPLVAARRELYLALRAQGWSYPMIGRFAGGRDHTTVLKALAPEEKRAKASAGTVK